MSRRTLIRAILSVLIIAYMAVVIPLTLSAERTDTFEGIDIRVNDPLHTGFLTAADVNMALGNLAGAIDTLKRSNLNTLKIERKLLSMPRVETATCRILNDGMLRIDVDPISPVARVFDAKGSAYINTAGKRVPSRPQYHVDVPIFTTPGIADSAMVARILPVLRAIKANPNDNALVSSLKIDRNGDIIIIPNVLGHVINFGDTSLVTNKFDRLRAFYAEVSSVQGWNAYDTLSVKWKGRVVATRRTKQANAGWHVANPDDIVDEVLDDDVMLTDVNLTQPIATTANPTDKKP